MDMLNLENKHSNWKTYIGVCCTDIQNGTDTDILVFLPEFSPLHVGTVKTDGAKVEFETTNKESGKVEKHNIAIAQCVRAVYFGRDNMSVPCVHKGELVHVIQYGGGYDFRWMPSGQKTEVRKFERLRLYVQDDLLILDGGAPGTWKTVNDSNSYYIELDTRPESRGVFIRTCRNNGELFKYEFSINTVDSTVTIADDAGNFIQLNSGIPSITLRNNHTSVISMIAGVINIIAPETINIAAPSINVTCANRNTLVEEVDTLTINKNRITTVAENEEHSIGANYTHSVGGTRNVTVVGAQMHWVGLGDTLTVIGARTHTVGLAEVHTVGGIYTMTSLNQVFLGKNFTVNTDAGSISWLP